ncbi:tetratricopeptide repeat protein [Acuticoccus sp. I52.16.1]|uniref:tetratricopeptide repeat protein n=1 Tax=Acuticoccus sp. I52.16.1 TaxID=2928472 RepID=UPI001FD30C1D|nr:tetratricopeptide repeat protein [Acuticoccus sp. I52.16.1]UOM36328.1 tetratricopeptide repeat protein [Acuticoccus sp. I52.16.1]
MRIVLTLMMVALTTPALSLPRWTADADTTVTAVQNRFLPRFFGDGGEQQEGGEANSELRIQQLETQVRMLTGQVEQLTFTVRRLQQLIEAGGAGQTSGAIGTDQRGAVQPGAGAPPRSLGQVPAQPAPSSTVGQAAPSNTFGQSGTGPVDLSALNGDLSATPPPASPTPSTRAAPSNPELDKVRDLQHSGRFAMAADAARTVLTDNPSGPVAGEARFMLGEALLAQRDFRAAANQFLETYTTDPNGARAAESLLKLSTSLNGLGESEAACSSLEELFGAYPNVSGSLRAQAEAERRTANCA